MALAKGTSIGPYEIESPLGSGGMGMVYRARDRRLQRAVAIKVLSAGLLKNEAARRRFRQEALALARLNHPNIAVVYDVGEDNGTDYLVMELVPGQSLAEKLRSGPLEIKQSMCLGAEIAEALEEAHAQGVIHRDLKPGNIVVTPKGHAKVLDFGLAKLLADDTSTTQSFLETQGALGTPMYMSPEQAQGKPVDSRCDLWSLGVVLYESLAGAPPFQAKTSLATLQAITQENPKRLRELCAAVPADAEHIVARAMEKDVAKRYQSAAEMSRDLSAVVTRLSGPVPAPEGSEVRLPRRYLVLASIVVASLLAAGGWFYHRSERRHWAREEAIPQIVKLEDQNRSLAAFLLLQEAEKYLPADPQLTQLVQADTELATLDSSPSGAELAIQDYAAPNSAWYRVGATPLKNVRIPNGYFRWKVTKAGLGEFISAPQTAAKMNFPLDAQLSAPKGMVHVSGGFWGDYIDFVGWIGFYKLPDYDLDKFEVTNRQYQQFVDSGGYQKRRYWPATFVQDGRELTWDQAMSLLRDKTGRPGPSTWEGGHYPERQADYPVTGVSWYEASAYAAYAGKSLPVLAQWYHAAPGLVGKYLVPASNFSRTGLAAVGNYKGLGPFGTYDMAGNAKEWVENQTGSGVHFALGGSWNTQTYTYSDPEALPAFDRAPTNGFRCVRNLSPLPAAAFQAVKPIVRDFAKEKPVSDEVFRAYQAMYAYDKNAPLNAKNEGLVGETADWKEEKVSFNAAYDGERMSAYLFLPKHVRPPYQTVVFFPSARVLFLGANSPLGDVEFFDYVVQSGRAVVYPIYKGTYGRQTKLVLPGGNQWTLEVATQHYKDLARTLDYLATRPDIDSTRMAYLGVSMGSAEGVDYATLAQDRFRTVILLDGGFFLWRFSPGVDQLDFAPRLKKPVLMVNGRYDYDFSVDRSQDPLFRMLGTPLADKRHVLLETPHDVTNDKPHLIREVLGWLDKYLGRVQ
jgi:serine/threonine protein kinase/dienelactone hydrolase